MSYTTFLDAKRFSDDLRPSMTKKQLSPHSIRNTTTTHLLRPGVDINTIRAWVGHVSLATTNIYSEVDLQMKERVLAKCEVGENSSNKRLQRYREDKELMGFLRKL